MGRPQEKGTEDNPSEKPCVELGFSLSSSTMSNTCNESRFQSIILGSN